MNNLNGTWTIVQTWNGHPPYRFQAEFKDGVISIEPGLYVGTYLEVNAITPAIAMGISNLQEKSIYTYHGTILGFSMGGNVIGATKGETAIHGTWNAFKQIEGEIEEKAHCLPTAKEE